VLTTLTKAVTTLTSALTTLLIRESWSLLAAIVVSPLCCLKACNSVLTELADVVALAADVTAPAAALVFALELVFAAALELAATFAFSARLSKLAVDAPPDSIGFIVLSP
jgi:hypothetical protein